MVQQRVVQLRHHTRSPSPRFRPASLLVALLTTILLCTALILLHLTFDLTAQSSNESSSSSTGIRSTKNNMASSASAVVAPAAVATALVPLSDKAIKESADLHVLFRDYYRNPQQGAAAVFSGTAACAQSTYCRLYLPVDTADSKRSHSNPLPGIALQTWKGLKEITGTSVNQDRSVIVLTDKNFFALGPSSLILLADGHGTTGHGVAEQVVADLPFRLFQALESSHAIDEAAVHQILKRVFLETDQTVLNNMDSDNEDMDGGSTVVMALYWGQRLYLVSAGDSTGATALWNASQNKATVLQQAVRHKPADPLERQRIEAAGGQVVEPPGDPSSRVMIPSPRGFMFDTALAMSRCMGDAEGKRPGYLTAEPSVLSLDLSQYKASQEVFVVVSSDGVTDMFPLEALLDHLGAALHGNGPLTLEQAVEVALERASDQWLSTIGNYRDDMSLLVARVSIPAK